MAELNRVVAAGVRFGTVLASAGYGASAVFRHGLDDRTLNWAFDIPCNQKVYDLDMQLMQPASLARTLVEDSEPHLAEDVLAELP